ncbi:hypothetical protein TrST_g8063 [Triparma strigata]|uniref:AP2/ERF domain-containing protein n=1 Tax=Triparma strigata TaxID=1606541 RepID=A0A9W7E9J2_9STRA|nr:hypothetical protein TrST_g8063 [Triparma strigata]
MPDISWNFLLPGSGTHTFRWTGSNAYIDNSLIKMSKHTSPSYTYSFEGVDIRLERKHGTSSMEPVKWKLKVDGRLVEEHVLSKDGTRDFKNAQEGSYQIATHFTPVGKPRAIWVFLAKEKSHNVSICHDHNTGRVELTLDGQLVSGRKYKILDSGIKLDFASGVLSGSVKVTPNMFSFKYECVCNGCVLKPCHTMRQGAIDVEPIDVTQGGATLIGGMAEEVPKSKSTVGWTSGEGEALQSDDDVDEKGASKPPASALAEAKFSDSEDEDEEEDSSDESKHNGGAAKATPSNGNSTNTTNTTNSNNKKTVVIAATNNSAAPGTSFDYANYEPTLPRGVHKEDNGYSAGVTIKGRFLNLGTFDTVEQAAEAYAEGLARYKRK